MLQDHLRQAEQHIAEGEIIIVRQTELIADLEGKGSDARAAWALLEQFQEALAEHKAHRDRLLAELSADRTGTDASSI